jgi:CO/xanthine dehydrogenase FAD-binding subunit
MTRYHSPTDLTRAFDLMDQGPVALIAGGTDWFPARGDTPVLTDLVDVTGLPGFRAITRDASGWRIGAAVRWADILRADLPAAFDGVKAAAREVGSVQIQNAGTLAGNICNASPAADGIPPLLTLGAMVELVCRGGSRRLALSDFVTGVRQTALRPGEMVAAVHIPDQPPGTVAGFTKIGARRYLVISIAMVAATLRIDTGRIAEARVAVGACSAVAQRLPGFEAALRGVSVDHLPHVTPDHLAGLTPIDDIRGSAAYRLDSVATLTNRLIQTLAHGGADGRA